MQTSTSVYIISIATFLIIALHMFNKRENAGFLYDVVSIAQNSESEEAYLKELNESDEFIEAEQQIPPTTRAPTTTTAPLTTTTAPLTTKTAPLTIKTAPLTTKTAPLTTTTAPATMVPILPLPSTLAPTTTMAPPTMVPILPLSTTLAPTTTAAPLTTIAPTSIVTITGIDTTTLAVGKRWVHNQGTYAYDVVPTEFDGAITPNYYLGVRYDNVTVQFHKPTEVLAWQNNWGNLLSQSAENDLLARGFTVSSYYIKMNYSGGFKTYSKQYNAGDTETFTTLNTDTSAVSFVFMAFRELTVPVVTTTTLAPTTTAAPLTTTTLAPTTTMAPATGKVTLTIVEKTRDNIMNPSHFRLTDIDGNILSYTASKTGRWGDAMLGGGLTADLNAALSEEKSWTRVQWRNTAYDVGNTFVLTLDDPTAVVHRVDLVYFRANRSPTMDITVGSKTIRVMRMSGNGQKASQIPFERMKKQTAIFGE